MTIVFVMSNINSSKSIQWPPRYFFLISLFQFSRIVGSARAERERENKTRGDLASHLFSHICAFSTISEGGTGYFLICHRSDFFSFNSNYHSAALTLKRSAKIKDLISLIKVLGVCECL